jgi:hypothetical protein
MPLQEDTRTAIATHRCMTFRKENDFELGASCADDMTRWLYLFPDFIICGEAEKRLTVGCQDILSLREHETAQKLPANH